MTLTKKDHNERRLLANQVIADLHEAGELDQLRILQIQIKRCLEIAKENGKVPTY